jgi:4-amino-4-deoxy-L-arabinose transferase-like glycosyltransferase
MNKRRNTTQRALDREHSASASGFLSGNRGLGLGLFVAALALRLLFITQIAEMPTFNHPVMDEGYHIQLTDEILSGKLLPDEPFYRAPLYTYSLALLRLITGDNLFAVRTIQAVFGSLLPVMIFLLGLRLFNRKVALTAGALAVLYPTFIYYDASLLITSSMTLLSILIVWQAFRVERKPTLWRFVALGVLIGLAALARPNVLFYLPALAVWFWIYIRKQFYYKTGNALLSYALVIISSLIVIAPVTTHNWVVSGELIPIGWQGGYNFYLGNNHQATGWSATAPGIKSSWQGGYLDAINIAQAEIGRPLSVKEIDNYWWSRGFDEIQKRPGATLSLLARKFAFLFNGFEIPNNQNIYIVERFSPLAQALFARSPLYVPFGIIAPFALLGFLLLIRRAREYLPLLLFVISYSASIVLFFVCARYRQPLVPFAILLASYGFFEMLGLFKRKKWKTFAPFLAALVGLFVFSNYDFVGLDIQAQSASDHFLLGKAYQDQSAIAKAEIEYQAALADVPTFSDAHINLGLIAAARQDALNAERHFTAALKTDPDNSLALTNLAVALMQRDKLDESQQLLERARKVDALDYNIHYRLGLVYHLQERYSMARASYKQTLYLNPGFEAAETNLRIVEDVLLDSLAPKAK